MAKTKLPIVDQINKMKSSGIKFIIVSEESAKEFISNNTYYFKIKAFQKNYIKNGKGAYVNLDFAYLKDFSTIDMRFRKLVLSMVLSIEHSMKVKLNNDISNNPSEDGYSIVNEFFNQKEYQYIVKSTFLIIEIISLYLIKTSAPFSSNGLSETVVISSFECVQTLHNPFLSLSHKK